MADALPATAVLRLLPHRRPFLMVDAVVSVTATELVARRAISLNEGVFDGHLPDLPLWPGVYTIEGLAQATLLHRVLLKAAAESGMDAAIAAVLAGAGGVSGVPGVLAAVDVKLLAPVYAGAMLEYRTRPVGSFGAGVKVAVEASVGRDVVAKGHLTVMEVAPR